MEDFQYALDLAFGDQGDRVIGNKSLIREQLGARKLCIFGCQIRHLNDAPFQDCTASVTLPDSQIGRFDVTRMEPLPNHEFQPATARLYQQYTGSIYLKLIDDLVDHERQCDLQVKNTADGAIDRTQGSQSLKLLDSLFVQVHAMNGIAADLCQRVQYPQFSHGELAWQRYADKHDTNNTVFRVQRHTGPANAGRNLAASFFWHIFRLMKFARDNTLTALDHQPRNALPEFVGKADVFIIPALLRF